MAKGKAAVGSNAGGGDNQRVLQTTAVSFQGVLESLDCDRTIELGVEEEEKSLITHSV